MRTRRFVLSLCGAFACFGANAMAAGDPIMPLSQVHAGMNCTARTVIHGTAISTFDVHVIDIVQDPVQGARILISVSGPAVDQTGVAEGFSGSPIYCSDGITDRVIGAISEGIGQYGNNVALATPIEQMLGEPVKPPRNAPRMAFRTHPLAGPLTVGGLAPSVMNVLQQAARHDGRAIVAAPAGSATSFPVQPLIPGASVATAYSSGAIPVGAIGTVTYRDGNTVYAFGHELDGAGRRSLLLQDAYVYYVVNNPNTDFSTSYKLAAPGHTVGTLSSDTPNAVVGEVGAPPRQIPLDVTAHDLDTGARLTLDSQVADETDVGQPLGSSILDLVAPLAVAQAATQIFNGPPANQSGRMCVTVHLRETRAPLSFCNRYVGTGFPGDLAGPSAVAMAASFDIGSALSLIDQVQFAALHVTHVNAEIWARRGLEQATIVAAHAPTRVRAGARIPVRLRIRVYRGPLRTIGLRIRVPRDEHGRVTAMIANAQGAGLGAQEQGLAQALAQALIGGVFGPPASGSGPSSLAELRKDFAHTAVYDGLAERFKGHKPTDVYRDPKLVIEGVAKLKFDVIGGRRTPTGHRHHRRSGVPMPPRPGHVG
jgi:hypothetical protein